MAAYNQTNIYTDLNGQSNAFVDLGLLLVDISNNQNVYGNKTFTSMPVSTATPASTNQLATVIYTKTIMATKTPTIQLPASSYIASTQYIYNGSFQVKNGYTTTTNFITYITTTYGNTQSNGIGAGVGTYTNTTQSFVIPNSVSLTQSNVLVATDTPANADQLFTFGTSAGGGIWVAGGYGGNTLAYSTDGINWVGLGNSIFNISVNGVAWNGTMWVATGVSNNLLTGNTMAYSYNGINWTGLGRIFNSQGTSVAWNGIIWVASGNDVSGNIITLINNTFLSICTSYNGIDWNKNPNLLTPINSLTWNGSNWLAGSDGLYCWLFCQLNTNYYCHDGINWYKHPLTVAATVRMFYKGDKWFNLTGSSVQYSYDGVNWTAATFTGTFLTSQTIDYNGNTYVLGCAVSNNAANGQYPIFYSFNGITWTGTGTNIYNFSSGYCGPGNILWNGSIWVSMGGDKPTYRVGGNSYDGIIWSYSAPTVAANLGYGGSSALAYNGKLHIFFQFVNTSTSSSTMWYSADAINWTENVSTIIKTSGGAYTLLWIDTLSLWLSCTFTYPMIYSYDGLNWSIHSSPPLLIGAKPYDLYWNGTYIIAVCNVTQGTIGNAYAYSYDGFNWFGNTILNTQNTTPSPIGHYGLAWGRVNTASRPNTYNILRSLNYSPNTASWSGTTTILQKVNTVVYNGYLSLAGGILTTTTRSIPPFNVNMSYLSNTGNNWVDFYNPILNCINGLAWNGSIWVAVGGNGPSFGPIAYPFVNNGNCIAISVSGITGWTGVATNDNLFNFGQSVTWNGTLWIATGITGNIITGGNTLAYSYNGVNWFPLGSSVFIISGNVVAWSGKRANTMYIPQTRTLALCNSNNNAGTIAYAYAGTNSILYDLSNNWTWAITNRGLSTTTLFTQANAAAWNGAQWIAVGTPVSGSIVGNTLAFSSIFNGNSYISNYAYNLAGNVITPNSLGNAGNVWIGLGNYTFYTAGNGIGWNGNIWVAAGQGGNSLAYSPNGFSWFGLGTRVFSTSATSVTWSGTYWLATGVGGNTLAYSADGVIWVGLGRNIFTTQANGAAWNGRFWVAAGQGGNTLAMSWDTVNWRGLGATYFTTLANAVATNTDGTMWIAAGQGTNTLMYSTNGILWTTVNSNPFSTTGNAVTWNGKFWVASGTGTNTLGYSPDGINWTGEGSSLIVTPGLSGSVVANMGVGSAIIPTNYTTLPVTTTPLWAMGGTGTNTLAFSLNGIVWTGVGNSVFTTQCNSVAYAPIIPGNTVSSGTWVAAGQGTNSLAYSTTGNTWTGLGTVIFSTSGQSVQWNGVMWVATGAGIGNTLAYSYTGNVWFGSGRNIFNVTGNAIAWSGSMWVATGSGSTLAQGIGNTLAYSYNGIHWSGAGCNIFTTSGNGVAWNGIIWVAVGAGGNTMAYSYNGIQWFGLGSSVFSTVGNGIAWNGQFWVAVGAGTNSIAWSPSGITRWTALGQSNAATANLSIGYSVTWSGQIWMVGGIGSTSITVYSPNGIQWFNSANAGVMTAACGVAYSNYFTNKLTFNTYGPSKTQTLDIVADSYYQTGYNTLNYNLTMS